jgi:SAM-dependent methyltransferase
MISCVQAHARVDRAPVDLVTLCHGFASGENEFMDPERVAREKAAYDVGDFTATRDRLRSLYRHVYKSPNSQRIKAQWQSVVREAVSGRRVLELGSGEGFDCLRFLEWGASQVHGIEVSAAMLAIARRHERPGLEFFDHDLHQPERWPHTYDLIFGRSVLHHLDYRPILEKLYTQNLVQGGQMIFVEPLGEGFLMRMYWKFGSRVHTPDERPFCREDIEWLRSRFGNVRLIPMNYASIPAAAVSWMLGMEPDNVLTRFADRLDVSLANRFERLALHYRSAVLHIKKTAPSNAVPTP